jgi:hypothetical protein
VDWVFHVRRTALCYDTGMTIRDEPRPEVEQRTRAAVGLWCCGQAVILASSLAARSSVTPPLECENTRRASPRAGINPAARYGRYNAGMSELHRKHFWKRKRWIAAVILWLSLPALYPASLGPIGYACGRGWISREAVTEFYGPLRDMTGILGLRLQEDNYAMLWYRLGQQHRVARK